MELDFEKDVLRLMKLLAYHIKAAKYNNPHIENFEEYFGTPWLEVSLSDEDLKGIGIPRSQAKMLKGAVYEKQGMRMTDFFTPTLSAPDEYEEPDTAPIMIHTLFWIEDIIKNIENKSTVERKLLTKILNAQNSITLNELTGDFTYNNTKGKLIPTSRKFRILHSLLKNEEGFVTYNNIARMFYNADYNKANHSKGFSDVLDDLKRDLKILPSSESSNPDCFENMSGVGYRLMLP